jgi:Ca2+/Na+ antiporter
MQPPSGPSAAGRGPIGKPSKVGLTILLSIVTLGIWMLIWTYRQFEEFKKYTGKGLGGVVGLVLAIFIFPVIFFMAPIEIKAMYEAEGEESPVQPILGLWFLLPIVGFFIWYIKVQEAINDFWMRRGAPAP